MPSILLTKCLPFNQGHQTFEATGLSYLPTACHADWMVFAPLPISKQAWQALLKEKDTEEKHWWTGEEEGKRPPQSLQWTHL